MTPHLFMKFYEIHPSIAVLGVVTLICLVLLVIHFLTTTSVKPMDVSDIAGDDFSSSQLDLAQAYIEMGNPGEAKSLLNQVIQAGSPTQKMTARKLIASCE